MAKLGDVATYINGYAFKPSDWSNSGVPIIRIQDLTGSGYQANRYNGEYNKKYEILSGDILISWSASLGVYVWSGEKAVLNQHIFKVVFDKALINRSFFVHQVSRILENASSETHGATMKHLTKPVFDALPFYLPLVEKQDQIAAILDNTSSLISLRKQQLEKLDQLIKSQFIEMFGDPVTNPMGWDIRQFAEIASSRLGKMLDSKKQTGKGRYPYLANFNVQWFKINLDMLNKMDFDEKDKKEFTLNKGDLLVCEGGEIGRCAIWNGEIEECFFQKAIHRVRCDTNVILPEYLARVFYYRYQHNSFEDVIGSKSTIAHLTGEKLKGLSIVVPPIDLQNQFAAFVQQVDKSKLTIQQSLDKLNILYKSLMQQYFG